MRGASQLPDGQPCPVRQTSYSAAANEVIYSKKATHDVFALCQGWALRFVQLADGRRQNLAILLPGDLSLSALFQEEVYYSVEAVTDLRIARFARPEIKTRLLSDPKLLEFFGKACAAEQRGGDELAVDLGRRSAEERVSRVILDLVQRITGGRIRPNYSYRFPLLQRHIADLTGLTPVHVSRVKTELRNAGVLHLAKGFVRITNLTKLMQIARPK
jgi:CRP-like cAMP-binding protein